jgi:hypothetical protein
VATTTSIRPTIGTPQDTPLTSRPRHLLRLWRLTSLWHLTSLDAPTVAVIWALAFAWAFQIHLPLWLPTTLALATWFAYIADRLLDAHRAQKALQSKSGTETCSLFPAGVPGERSLLTGVANPYSLSLRPRHHFHWRYRRLFLPIALTAALASLTLVLLNMPPTARTRNSVLAAAALAYFTSIHNPWRLPSPKLRIPKELLVALIFTLACAIPTWARISANHLTLLIPTLTFIVLAWLNCQAIETWESTPRRAPIFPLAALLATLTLLADILLARHHPRVAALEAAAAVSAALLAYLDRTRHRLSPTTLRALADLVLLTPLVLLIMPGFAQ